jgi:hypothetical protein
LPLAFIPFLRVSSHHRPAGKRRVEVKIVAMTGGKAGILVHGPARHIAPRKLGRRFREIGRAGEERGQDRQDAPTAEAEVVVEIGANPLGAVGERRHAPDDRLRQRVTAEQQKSDLPDISIATMPASAAAVRSG